MTTALAEDRLGTVSVAQIAMGAAAPLTVVAGIIPVGFATTGVLGVPLAFLLVAAVLLVFCPGFCAMGRNIAHAGALYAYIAQGLGRPLGVGAAWQAALAYNLFQVSAYGLFGASAQALVNPLLHVSGAWWAYAAIAWALVAILGIARVDINSYVLGVLIVLEVAVIVLFDVADVAHPAGGAVTLTTLAPTSLLTSGAGAALVIAVTGFTGFENCAYYAEEAKDRRRTIPAATYLCVVVSTILYAGSAWAMSVATGPDRIADSAGKAGSDLVFTLAAGNLGAEFAALGHALLLTGVFAAMTAFHNASARYAYTLGREGVLWSWLGRVSRSGAPLWGSLTQSAIGAAVIIGYAVAGANPVEELFFYLGTTGGFGVLVLLTVTSAAVIVYFRRRGDVPRWRSRYAPAIALVLLAAASIGAFIDFPQLLGVDGDSPLRWVFPGMFLVVGLLGVARAVVLAKRRPDIYERIGQGISTASPSITDRGVSGVRDQGLEGVL